MGTKDSITKFLAVVGTLFVWAPILGTLFIAASSSVRAGRLHLDWLMPIELFPAALVGGGLLLVAAVRASARVRLIAWTLGIIVALLIAGLGLPLATGLASGETEPTQLVVVLSAVGLGIYGVGLVVLGIAGVQLLIHLLGRQAGRVEA